MNIVKRNIKQLLKGRFIFLENHALHLDCVYLTKRRFTEHRSYVSYLGPVKLSEIRKFLKNGTLIKGA
jgi:hypothetical protein